jgi:predicted negative regulator of RcsB-dependent stress response
VWLLAGQLFAAKDNKQSAREHFEKALALDPKLVFAREELAKLDK